MNPSANTTRPRVFLADDHPLMRDALRELVNRQPDLVCCGEAGSAGGVIVGVEESHPDLVLLDLRLQDGDGLELIKCLRSLREDLIILVFSQCDEDDFAERALRSGARGYLMKENAAGEVLTAIRAVLAGEIYMSRKIAAQLLFRGSSSGSARNSSPQPARRSGISVEVLSDRELQVFHLLGASLTNAVIAEQLHISIKTVETHRENIKHKLGIGCAADLMRQAREWHAHHS